LPNKPTDKVSVLAVEQFKQIVESTNNPIGLVDHNYVYLYANDSYSQALNKPIDEIIGHRVPELFGDQYFKTKMEPHYQQCLAGEIVSYQDWFDFPGWGRRYMDVRYYPFQGEDDQATAVVVNAHDITIIKDLELQLRESEERFRAFMDNNPACMYMKDQNDTHIYGNRVAWEFTGMEPERFVGSKTGDVFSPEIAQKLIALDRIVLDGETPQITEEYKDLGKDGIFWFKDIKFPIKLPSGKKLLGGIAFDITDSKKAEQTLTEQLEFEQLIAGIASQLAQIGKKQLDDAINTTLEALGRFLKTERAFLAQFTHDGKSLYHRSIWAAESIEVPSNLFKMDFAEDSPWLAQQLRLGKVINTGPGLTDLPDESGNLRQSLELGGITSGVVVPIRVENKSIGMIGLDTVGQPREYPPPIVERLKILADMLGTTLQRIEADEINHELLEFEDLISKLSATFIHIEASEIDRNIERGLGLIVEFLELEFGNLIQSLPDQDIFTITHAFSKEGEKPSPSIFKAAHFPWFAKKLLSRESFCFSNPRDLPKEAQAEKEYFIQAGIISGLVFPLEAAGIDPGAISLMSSKREHVWPEKLIQQYKIIVEVFSNALLRKQADDNITKAFTEIKQLKDRLEKENVYLREEIELKHQHDEIIGKSKPVMAMLNSAEQVAETDSTVLILGETGTGKELLANAIHRFSRRKGRTMIKVNCAALPATLIESELFGREKGAYTGSLSRQIGRFEIADGSTLFLDEIGELPFEVQAKLLRVLQEGQFERLGSPQTLSTDARIIASTNRDLAKSVAEGNFREDLYYRLNVFPVTVPPLRERSEDIPLLVWNFVKELESSMGKTIHQIPKKDLAALQQYTWPGNIRELKNVVENAMIVAKEKTLRIAPPTRLDVKVKNPLKLEDVERKHIGDVLKRTSWRVSGHNGAAELLGLKPTTLESRMKKLGIVRLR